MKHVVSRVQTHSINDRSISRPFRYKTCLILGDRIEHPFDPTAVRSIDLMVTTSSTLTHLLTITQTTTKAKKTGATGVPPAPTQKDGKKQKTTFVAKRGDPPAELLEELAAKFVLNCPEEELNSFERILFLVEQAHWYYEDFVREEPQNKNVMRTMKLREFAELMFHKCSALSKYRGKVDGIYKNFLMYKLSIPTGGLIILNPQMDKVLLVKGWNSGSSWGFPKGKINRNEPERECAAREVHEEVGVDFLAHTNENDSIIVTRSVDKHGAPGLKQRSRLFIVPNISEQTIFVTQTRKEIGSIAWHSVKELVKSGGGKKFFMVGPFIQPLLKWIQNKKKELGGAQLFQFEGGGLNLGPEPGAVPPASPGIEPGTTQLSAAPIYLSELEAAATNRFPSMTGFSFDVKRIKSAMA